MDDQSGPAKALKPFRVHILVFLLAFLAALTVAHPAFFFTDEWITANQLAQMHDGNQAILNEGKYGSFENGTVTSYFTSRNNYLGYPLFYPLIAFPAECLVYFFGNDIIFFITYLWTFLLIVLALTLNKFFPNYIYMGKYRWTSGLILISFVSLLLNLVFYVPFNLTGKNSGPEIIAIIFTNTVLFAVLAVMIYEILKMIFQNSPWAFFGTAVCVSCSSYLFWTNVGKDHLVVILLLAVVLFMVIRFLSENDLRALSSGFFFVGLLIWARPELGIFIFIALFVGTSLIYLSDYTLHDTMVSPLKLMLSPLFTLAGAAPFFINNYLVSGNIFIPAFVLTQKSSLAQSSIEGSNPVVDNTVSALLQVNSMTTVTPLSTFPSDVYGILFFPQSGSMGILPLVPVFVSAVMILPVLLMKIRIRFDCREKMILGILVLLSLAVFGAYLNRVAGLNTDLGIMPDIRYLSPLYLPLTIAGLMIIRKAPGITERPFELLADMGITWLILLPVSLSVILFCHSPPLGWNNVFILIDRWATMAIFVITVVFVLLYYRMIVSRTHDGPGSRVAHAAFAFMCALPLVWQAAASFLALLFVNAWGGYYFWIPVLFKVFSMIHMIPYS
jgi:hypothetical protein